MRSKSEADRRRGMTKLIVGFQNFANVHEYYKFSYSREISKSVTNTGKETGAKLNISTIFKSS